MKSKQPKVGDVVAIEWLDHFSMGSESGGAWLTLEQSDLTSRMRVQTYGRIVAQDTHHWIIAGTDGDLDHPERKIYSDMNKILKSAVVKWKKLL